MYFSEMLTWCFLALVANTYAIPLTYSNSWTGGCQGTVQLHANANIHGWRATFTFDGPVDKFEVRLSISKHFLPWNLVLVYLFLSAIFSNAFTSYKNRKSSHRHRWFCLVFRGLVVDCIEV